jgi:hypothetical protein
MLKKLLKQEIIRELVGRCNGSELDCEIGNDAMLVFIL